MYTHINCLISAFFIKLLTWFSFVGELRIDLVGHSRVSCIDKDIYLGTDEGTFHVSTPVFV